jgi:hypothetical protein
LEAQAEEKNVRKNPALLPRGPFAETFFSGSGKVWALFYFEGVKDGGITAFKGKIRKFSKKLAVLSLGLMHALMMLAIPTFLVRMFL